MVITLLFISLWSRAKPVDPDYNYTSRKRAPNLLRWRANAPQYVKRRPCILVVSSLHLAQTALILLILFFSLPGTDSLSKTPEYSYSTSQHPSCDSDPHPPHRPRGPGTR